CATSDFALRAKGQQAGVARQLTEADSTSEPPPAEAFQSAAKRIEAGRAARMGCDLEQAIVDFSEAIRLAPSAPAYALRGRTYAEHGDDPQAWADFARAIALDPNQADAFASRGWLHAMRGEYE